jgi:hypothetical protein
MMNASEIITAQVRALMNLEKKEEGASGYGYVRRKRDDGLLCCWAVLLHLKEQSKLVSSVLVTLTSVINLDINRIYRQTIAGDVQYPSECSRRFSEYSTPANTSSSRWWSLPVPTQFSTGTITRAHVELHINDDD